MWLRNIVSRQSVIIVNNVNEHVNNDNVNIVRQTVKPNRIALASRSRKEVKPSTSVTQVRRCWK